MFHRCFVAFLIGLFLTVSIPVHAQVLPAGDGDAAEPAPQLPDPLTPEAVRELVSQLSDAEVRRLLLERLDAVARQEQAVPAEAGVAGFLADSAMGVAHSIRDSVAAIPLIPGGLSQGISTFADRFGDGELVVWFVYLIGAIAAGLVAERLAGRLAQPWRADIENHIDRGLLDTHVILGKRFVLDFGGIVVFLAVSATVIWTVMPADPVLGRQTAWSLIANPIVYPRVAAALARFLVAPSRPDLRIVHTDDWSARFFYVCMQIQAFLLGLSAFLLPFLDQNGVPMGELRIGFWLNLAFYCFLFWVSVRARSGLQMMLTTPDGDQTAAEAFAAKIYPYACMVLIVLNWLMIELIVAAGRFDLLDGRQDVTLILLIFAPVFDVSIRGVVRHFGPRMTGEGQLAEEAHEATKRALVRIGRVLALGALLWITVKIWDLDVTNIAAAGVGVQFAAGLIKLLVVLGIGYLVLELVTLWINLKLAREMTAAGVDLNSEEPGGGEGGGTGGSRLSTILPLMRWAAQAVIVVMTVLIALGNIGIDITPLLAGAGIVGIAIGFGAQKLVTDIVSGIFFLIDDAFRVGEYIDIEGTLGTVEKISIRSLQLRHHRGAVHTIPFGEIPRITNYSRDWVIMKLRFTVPFDTDINKVKKIFKQIGREMMEVPEFAEDMLQPFKSQGVLEVDDVGMVVRGKFMAKPGKQFTLRKEVYSRVQKAFDENGIQFARKEVRVRLDGDPDGLSEAERKSIGAAAAQAAEPDAPEPAR